MSVLNLSTSARVSAIGKTLRYKPPHSMREKMHKPMPFLDPANSKNSLGVKRQNCRHEERTPECRA